MDGAAKNMNVSNFDQKEDYPITVRSSYYAKNSNKDSNCMISIDSNTKHIYNLIEVGANKTKTTLTVNSFKTNEPLSKTLFTFDKIKYKDYYINKID